MRKKMTATVRSVPTTPPQPTLTAGSPPENENGLEPAVEAIADFLGSPPAAADRVVIIAVSPAGDQVVQERSTAETKRSPDHISAQVAVACERWADAERRSVRFRAAWMRGERVLASTVWQFGASDSTGHELDGSVTSFLVQQQQFALAQHKLQLESFEMVQDGWSRLFAVQNKRIEALERDNQELRDRLRKLDDVGSEIAIETARADIEARGRTADLIEKRVLPIAQAVIAQRMAAEQSAPRAPSSSSSSSSG